MFKIAPIRSVSVKPTLVKVSPIKTTTFSSLNLKTNIKTFTPLRQASVYVGNIPWSATETELHSLFEKYGPVKTVKVVLDRETGRPRGFAFVEMEDADAPKAIENLNGTSFGGRALRVTAAAGERERGNFGSRPRGRGRFRGERRDNGQDQEQQNNQQ